VLNENARFLEGVGVQEEVDPLAGGEAAFGVELGDALLAAPFEDGLAAPAQLFDGGASAQVRGSVRESRNVAKLRGILSEARPVYNAGSVPCSCPGGAVMTPRRSRPELSQRRLDRMNWMEMGEWVPREIETVLVPVGTLEPHGILSLGTDNEIPARLSEAVAERLNALVAPTIPYGVTAHLGALPGATHIPAPAFTEYAIAVLTALTHQGFRNLVVMNGHGGNTDALKEAARRVHEETGAFLAVFNWWTDCYPLSEEILGVPGGHAGADETAAMIAIAPEQVFPDRWDPSLAFEHRNALLAFPEPGSLIYYGGKRSDPVLNPKKARDYWTKVVEHVGEVLEDLVVRWEREGYPAPRGRRGAAGGDGAPAGANGHGGATPRRRRK